MLIENEALRIKLLGATSFTEINNILLNEVDKNNLSIYSRILKYTLDKFNNYCPYQNTLAWLLKFDEKDLEILDNL